MVRAPNEPTMQEEGRENEPPKKRQEKANVGTQDGKINGEPKENPNQGFDIGCSRSVEYYSKGNQVSASQDHLKNPQTTALRAATGRAGHKSGCFGRAMGSLHKSAKQGAKGMGLNGMCRLALVGHLQHFQMIPSKTFRRLGSSRPNLRFGPRCTVPWSVVRFR